MKRARILLAAQPEHQAKLAELTTHADPFPLTVAQPQPAKWTPPPAGAAPKNKKKSK